MPNSWFPQGTNRENGWRLDIVSLLAVIGESSMEAHSQALTSSWTCILPRIIPAPQALLKPARPTRMPQVNAAVVGVHNGTLVPSLNYFAGILAPIDDLPPFSFKVLRITHKDNGEQKQQAFSYTTGYELNTLEDGGAKPTPRLLSKIMNPIKRMSRMRDGRPNVPPQKFSPLSIVSVLSFFWTCGLIIWAAVIGDGTAIVALCTTSFVSSIVGYASWWQPVLMKRSSKSKVPAGDVVIRTREGAFLLVLCNEDVARELYTGTEECKYYVRTQRYRALVGIGTFLLMVSVILLGNCDFVMQAAVGLSYMVLNGVFWAASLIEKTNFWDLSSYDVDDVTPADAQNAHRPHSDSIEGRPSFTRTMWYAIRETKKIGWVKRGGAAPSTDEWDQWLAMAELNAASNKRDWPAVQMREYVVGRVDSVPQAMAPEFDTAVQHAPAHEVLPQETQDRP